MCSPISDGAAAVVLCTKPALRRLADIRPVKVLSSRADLPVNGRIARGTFAGVPQTKRTTKRVSVQRMSRSRRCTTRPLSLKSFKLRICDSARSVRAVALRTRSNGLGRPNPGQSFGRSRIEGTPDKRDRSRSDLRTRSATPRRGRRGPRKIPARAFSLRRQCCSRQTTAMARRQCSPALSKVSWESLGYF